MKSRLLISAGILFVIFSVGAFAQTQQQDHQEHHPGGAPTQTQTPPPSPLPTAPLATTQAPPGASTPPQAQMPMGQIMQGMPEQCRSMMQNMPQGCMQMMRQMMQGGMGGGTMGRQERGPIGAGMMMRMMFSLMDADGDGSISLQEFQAAHERIFRGMDQNKDGRVTMEEMQSFMGAGVGR
jgi:hypothetical protein